MNYALFFYVCAWAFLAIASPLWVFLSNKYYSVAIPLHACYCSGISAIYIIVFHCS